MPVTPNKRRPNRKKSVRGVDDFTKNAISRTLYDLVKTRRHVTLYFLLKEVRRREIDFKGGKETLRLLLHDMGFKQTSANGRELLVQKRHIRVQTTYFLREYRRLRDQFPIVWLDETWIFQYGAMKFKHWNNGDPRSFVTDKISNGKRFIVLHAGGDNGFVPGASLLFASQNKEKDYHGSMNFENFSKWWTEQLLPNLFEPTLIIMDNAVNPQPCSRWTVPNIKQWLEKRNIDFLADAKKPDLLKICKANREPVRYVLDEMAKERGHTVLRLPPYYCVFNPIELIWGIVKRYYDSHMGKFDDFSDEGLKRRWSEALNTVTTEVWRACIKKTNKIVDEAWEQEMGKNKVEVTDYDAFKICLNGSDSESDDDSDTGSELETGNEIVPTHQESKVLPSAAKHSDCRKSLFSEESKKSGNASSPSLEVVVVSDGECHDAPLPAVETTVDFINMTTEEILRTAFTADPYQIVVQGFGYTLRGYDLQSLKPNEELDGEVINMYFQLITARAIGGNPSVFAFATFFYPRLVAGTYLAVVDDAGKVDIFSKDIVLVPIHLRSRSHWALVIIRPLQKTVTYFDSIFRSDSEKEVLDHIWEYLVRESQKRGLGFVNRTEWRRVSIKDVKQTGGLDCGIFVCAYAEVIARNCQFTLTQADMSNMREQMVVELCQKKLSYEAPSFSPPSPPCKVKKNAKIPKKTSAAKPAPRNRPVNSKPTVCHVPSSTDGVMCLISSHIHQRAYKLRSGKNTQSTFICASALPALKVYEESLSPSMLDTLIYDGHDMYVSYCTENGIQIGSHIPATKIDTPVLSLGRKFLLKVRLLCTGLYIYQRRCTELANAINNVIENDLSAGVSGFFLDGHGSTVCIWRLRSNKFLLFNPRCVDTNNQLVTNIRAGAARLFKCHSVGALAKVALINDIFDENTWALSTVTITDIESAIAGEQIILTLL